MPYSANMAVSTLVILGIVFCVFQPIINIANLLTIVAFMKVRTLQNHTSNLLIFALSLADFVTGIYVLLYYGIPLVFSLRPLLNEIGCMMSVPLDNIYITGNLLLVAISIDRVLLVSKDYSKYVKMVTKFRLKLTMGICFLIGQIPSVFELSFWNYAKKNNANAATINFDDICLYPAIRLKWVSICLSCFYYVPLFLVGTFCIIFVKRLLIRISNKRRIGPPLQSAGDSIEDAEGIRDEIARSSVEERSHDTTKKRYIKPAITLAALVSAMCISLLPNCISLVVEALSGSLNTDVRYIMWMILQLNPFLDPLFFAATQKGIRDYYGAKIRELFRDLCNRN